MKRGIDVSAAQGIISLSDWMQIRRTRDFAIIKCGNGNAGFDDRYRPNLAAARKAGLVVGAYHVGFPLPVNPKHPGREAKSQAAAHWIASQGCGSDVGEIPPILDLEWPPLAMWQEYGCTAESISAWSLEYLDAVAQWWQREPMIYTYPDWWSHMSDRVDMQPFARYRLWLADYRGAPHAPAQWEAATIWQNGGGSAVLPNGALVDEDLFLGTDEEWSALLV